MTEPEIRHQTDKEAVDGRPLPSKGADDDDQKADEQKVDAEPLELGIASPEHQRDIEPDRQPCHDDPQHRELRIPCTGDRVGKIFYKRQTIEPLSLDRIMNDNNAQQHLPIVTGKQIGRAHV